METLMKTIGFRKTLYILTGLALVILVAVCFLDPVEKYMKKISIDGEISTGEKLYYIFENMFMKHNFETAQTPLILAKNNA